MPLAVPGPSILSGLMISTSITASAAISLAMDAVLLVRHPRRRRSLPALLFNATVICVRGRRHHRMAAAGPRDRAAHDARRADVRDRSPPAGDHPTAPATHRPRACTCSAGAGSCSRGQASRSSSAGSRSSSRRESAGPTLAPAGHRAAGRVGQLRALALRPGPVDAGVRRETRSASTGGRRPPAVRRCHPARPCWRASAWESRGDHPIPPRRSGRRLQIRWFVAAAVAVRARVRRRLIEWRAIRADRAAHLTPSSPTPGILAMPIAIGIAITPVPPVRDRPAHQPDDRVGDRDRVLVAVFAVLVVALQAILAPVTEENTLAVAASTLVAFALFQPLRRRVQRTVDRRFDRARYDGQTTTAVFADRVRNEVDLERSTRSWWRRRPTPSDPPARASGCARGARHDAADGPADRLAHAGARRGRVRLDGDAGGRDDRRLSPSARRGRCRVTSSTASRSRPGTSSAPHGRRDR